MHTDDVQVNTCALLAERYTAIGRSEDAAICGEEMEQKSQELQEVADAAVMKVRVYLLWLVHKTPRRLQKSSITKLRSLFAQQELL